MRSSLFTLFFTCLLVLVAGWTKEDHEIFRLRDEIELHEGEGVTFYDFVGIKPSASQIEIQKAYRKRSAQLHPDKAERNFVANRLQGGDSKTKKTQVGKRPSQREIKRAVKEAQERYQRLTVVRELLTGEGRARYNHFLKNGFPQWRSTGYYYERFRPGLFTTLIGLWIFCSGAVHYGILLLNHRQQKQFIERTIKKARKSAHGGESSAAGIPGLDNIGESAPVPTPSPPAEPEENGAPEPRNRKERRYMEKMQAKEDKTAKKPKKKAATTTTKGAVTADPEAKRVPKKRVVAHNGKVLLVANDGQVYLEEEDEEGNTEELLLSPDAIDAPAFSQTALIQAPVWAVDFIKRKISGQTDEE